MVRSKLWLTLALAAGSLAVHADTVYLSDGTEISGTIVEDNSNVVVVRRANGSVQSFRKGNVDAVVYDTVKRPTSRGVVEAVPAAPAPAAPAGPGQEAPPVTKQADAPNLPPAEAAKTEPAKPAEPAASPEAPKTAAGEPAKKEPEWTPPPNLGGFPDKAPRMKPEKEAAFMNVMNAMATTNSDVRAQAKSQMLSFGPDVLPYALAAAQHSNVEARSSAMDVVGQLSNSTEAIKSVIELMYSALPDSGEPASYQVPYLRAAKATLHKVTGQSFINVEPSSALVQVGMKSAIDWYNANIDRLPKQITDPKLDATDPEYTQKLRKARELKLSRRDWPRPPMAADIVNREPVGPGRTNITAKDVLSETDKRLNTLPTKNNYDTRGRDNLRGTDPRDSALNRP